MKSCGHCFDIFGAVALLLHRPAATVCVTESNKKRRLLASSHFVDEPSSLLRYFFQWLEAAATACGSPFQLTSERIRAGLRRTMDPKQQPQSDHHTLARDHERLQSQYAEIASLAGGLAHEIRNPLSTIALNLDLLLEDLTVGDSPRERRMLQKVTAVRKQCVNLERLLNDFLQFARVGTLEQKPADLNVLVKEFIDFYQPQAKEQGIEISPHLAANLPSVNIDFRLFLQVLTNLSRNAQQAMPRGGVLELQTYTRDDDRVMLDIIDTGEGMTAETQAKMFDTFFSTKKDGSGLGLPTVRKIVEAHGGTILCDSEPGRGTRFSIGLPIATNIKR